jgi:hypothetical protein
MKKVVLLSLLALSTILGSAQVDTTKHKGLFYKPAPKESPFSTEVGVATTNFWRGVDISKQTAVKVDAEYEPVNWFTVGTESSLVYNQAKPGYGNQINTRMHFNIYNVSLGFQDVYFHNNTGDFSDTAYFDLDKATTNHFVEATFRYKGDADSKIDLKANYVFYQRQGNPTGALYFETTYHIASNTQLFAGYVTGPSYVNFQNKAGFTNVGVNIKRELQFSEKFSTIIKTTISVNPGYKSITADVPSVSNRPLNVVLTAIF